MIARLFVPLAMKIAGGLILALAVALGFTLWRLDTWRDRAEDYAQSLSDEKGRHAVTRASLSQLETSLATYIADGKRREKAAQDALRAQRERSAALDAQIARLRSYTPTEAEMERCETPAIVGREL